MQKANFTSPLYYWTLLVFIIGLLIWNVFLTIVNQIFIGLLPIIIQVILLFLITSKNRYAKIGIKIWVSVFLIGASGLRFLGRFLQDVVYTFANADWQYYLNNGLTIALGAILLIYANKTIKIAEAEAAANTGFTQ